MTEQDKADLKEELEKYMNFWMEHMYVPGQNYIYPEIDIMLEPNKIADMGSMYLSRIVYGTVRGGECLNTQEYAPLAETALNILEELKNPSGGYYWARKYNMEWVHDPDNVNMAQAFVLYGLAEDAKENGSPRIYELLEEQLGFIKSTLGNGLENYLDGFDEQWKRGEHMTRSFATHFHLMEAYVKVYEISEKKEIRDSIRSLLHVIIDRFIDKENYSCIHRFTEDWKSMPNENWAGHNAECSWVMCYAARVIEDEELITTTRKMAVSMMDRVIETAKDEVHGGYYNLISPDGTLEQERSWWPQAEIAVGLWNAFEITSNLRYEKLARQQISYIKKHLLSENGEWFGSLNSKGEPVEGAPQVFFWKSMYHTLRYYDYFLTRV